MLRSLYKPRRPRLAPQFTLGNMFSPPPSPPPSPVHLEASFNSFSLDAKTLARRLLTTVLLDPTLDKECHSNPEGIAPRSIAARIREKLDVIPLEELPLPTEDEFPLPTNLAPNDRTLAGAYVYMYIAFEAMRVPS
jgi:hypothetical protein